MTPIYFPFTWIDESAMRTITAVFPQLVLYQPLEKKTPSHLQPFAQSGTVTIRIPVSENSGRVEATVKDYHNWASLHQGNDLAYLSARQPSVPLTDNLASLIQSDILHYENQPSAPAADRMFNARVFLEIASNYDAQQAEINSELSRMQGIEQRLMEAIGDDEKNASPSFGNLSLNPDDSSDFMLSERLAAWSALYLQDRERRMIGECLLTSSPAVMEWLQNEFEIEQVLEISGIPMGDCENRASWQESIARYLTNLQIHSWPSDIKTFTPPPPDAAAEGTVSIKGFIVPNRTPDALFQKISDNKILPSIPGFFSAEQIRHTTILLLMTPDDGL